MKKGRCNKIYLFIISIIDVLFLCGGIYFKIATNNNNNKIISQFERLTDVNYFCSNLLLGCQSININEDLYFSDCLYNCNYLTENVTYELIHNFEPSDNYFLFKANEITFSFYDNGFCQINASFDYMHLGIGNWTGFYDTYYIQHNYSWKSNIHSFYDDFVSYYLNK